MKNKKKVLSISLIFICLTLFVSYGAYLFTKVLNPQLSITLDELTLDVKESNWLYNGKDKRGQEIATNKFVDIKEEESFTKTYTFTNTSDFNCKVSTVSNIDQKKCESDFVKVEVIDNLNGKVLSNGAENYSGTIDVKFTVLKGAYNVHKNNPINIANYVKNITVNANEVSN